MCSKIDVGCEALELVGHVGSSVATSVFSSIASAFGNTADSAINWLWQQLSSSTSISLGGANFELDLGIVVSIAVVLCLGLFVIQMAVSALRRDAGGIGRAIRGLVIATVGCAITLASLSVLLAGIDQLCVGIVKVATGGTIATLGTKIIGDAVFTTAFASPPTILILSLFAIVAVAIVWFALVIRKMLILIAAIFAPIAFAGGVADLSRGWVRKWLESMLALVFSKLILIIIFVIGLGVLGGMGSATGSTPLNSITGEITGLLILLVAGFSPWMALRLVHFTGDHMATMAQSASHASAGASTVVGAPQKVAQLKYSAASLGGGHARSVAPIPNGGTVSQRGGEGPHSGAASGASAAERAADKIASNTPTSAAKTSTAGSGAISNVPGGESHAGGVASSEGTSSGPTVVPPTKGTDASRTPSASATPPAPSANSATSRRAGTDRPANSEAPRESSEHAAPSVTSMPPQPPRPIPQTRANPLEHPGE